MNFKEILERITIKQVIFAAMCVLLLLVIILTCMVISRVTNIFSTVNGNDTPSTSESTQETEPDETDGTTPSISLPPETTIETEPGHEHEFVLKETVDATCTNYGYNIYACSCGKQDIPLEEQVEPYGHSYGAGEVISATCTEDGCTRYVCSRCGNVDERNKVSATGHNHQYVETVEAACGVDGYDLYRCVNCGEEEMRNVVPALEHEFELCEEHGVTCTSDGYKLYECIYCGEKAKDEIVTSTGHAFGDWEQISEGAWTRTCGTCGLVENTSEMYITTSQASGSYVHDENGQPYKMYLIYVGTATSKDIIHYTINDYLDNGSLSYSYDTVQGLIVTYTTNSGESATIVLPVLQSTVLTVPNDAAASGATE